MSYFKGVFMKAYCATNDEGWGFIVYAETTNKAKSYLVNSNDFNEYGEFAYTDIRVRREPKMDKYYRGKAELDWDNAEDRIALVKELGWYCVDETFAFSNCETCPAKEFCDRYEEWLDSEVEE